MIRKSRIGLVLFVSLLAIAAMFTLLAVTGGSEVAQAAESAAPNETTFYCGSSPWCRVTLQSGDGITASAASENVVRQTGVNVFNRAELYCTMDENAVQTQTVKLQASPDNSVWVDVANGACAAQTADGTVHKVITDVPGAYWRAYVTLGGSNQTTPTIKLIMKRIP